MTLQNYELAQEVFDRGDATARTIASLVHRWMISEPRRANHPLRPVGEFDMAYFYDCLARTFSAVLPRPVDCGLNADRAVVPVNVPDLEKDEWRTYPFVTKGLAAGLLKCIHGDATDGGKPFDVDFACRIACAALDETALNAILSCNGDSEADSGLDKWLSGFSSSGEDRVSEINYADGRNGGQPQALASRYENGSTSP